MSDLQTLIEMGFPKEKALVNEIGLHCNFLKRFI